MKHKPISKRPFVKAYISEVKHPLLKSNDKLILFLLRSYEHSVTKEIFPSQHRIAKDLGISTKTVNRSLSKLERFGFIKSFFYEGKSKNYAFLPGTRSPRTRDLKSLDQGLGVLSTRDSESHYLDINYLEEEKIEDQEFKPSVSFERKDKESNDKFELSETDKQAREEHLALIRKTLATTKEDDS